MATVSAAIFVIIILMLPPCCHGNELDSYKWKFLVDDQIPNLSETCNISFFSEFGSDVGTRLDTSLLYNRSSNRETVCQKFIDSDKSKFECERREMVELENFYCYRFDITHPSLPPISNRCAMRYWQCGLVDEFFLNTISDEQKNRICEEKDWHSHCMAVFYSDRSDCVGGPEQKCEGNFWKKKKEGNICDAGLMSCYGEYINIFEVLLNMRNSDQPYVCGQLEECLVKPGENNAGLICSRNEAQVAEEFLCSSSTDVYGLKKLSTECRESIPVSFGYTVEDLESDPDKRQEICRSQDRSVMHLNLHCSAEENYIFNNFVCFDPNHKMLMVTPRCQKYLGRCSGLLQDWQHVSFLELRPYGKQEYCKAFNCLLRNCSEPSELRHEYCTKNELKYVKDYACLSSPSSSPPTTTITFSFVRVSLFVFITSFIIGNYFGRKD